MFLFRTDELTPQLRASASSRELTRGEVLCRQGESVHALFVVLAGRVQLCGGTSEGKKVPLYTAHAGECVAEAALFADNYCSDVVAEIKSSVLAFPTQYVREALRARPDWAAEFMCLQAKRCQKLRISLELRSLRTARERIMQYIATFAQPGSKTVTLDQTLKNVSDDLGLSHESFYRTLAQLIDEGVIKRAKNTLSLC